MERVKSEELSKETKKYIDEMIENNMDDFENIILLVEKISSRMISNVIRNYKKNSELSNVLMNVFATQMVKISVHPLITVLRFDQKYIRGKTEAIENILNAVKTLLEEEM